MKTITKQAVDAFMNAMPMRKANMRIEVRENVTIMYLHENPIAYRYNDPERTISVQNCGWFTNTTKERLNGIPGVRVNQSKGVWYLNGQVWNGKLTDI